MLLHFLLVHLYLYLPLLVAATATGSATGTAAGSDFGSDLNYTHFRWENGEANREKAIEICNQLVVPYGQIFTDQNFDKMKDIFAEDFIDTHIVQEITRFQIKIQTKNNVDFNNVS